MLHEGGLERVQAARLAQALYRGDFATVERNRQLEARIDPYSVDEHRAGATLSVVATLLRADQVELVTQQVEQGGPRLDHEPLLLAVDGEGRRNLRDRTPRQLLP